MFTKLDVVDNQPKIERRHDDVISDVMIQCFGKNKPFSGCKHNYFTLLFMIGSQWNLVGLIVDGQGRTYQYVVISYVTRCWAI